MKKYIAKATHMSVVLCASEEGIAFICSRSTFVWLFRAGCKCQCSDRLQNLVVESNYYFFALVRDCIGQPVVGVVFVR